jgi:hypothetical protein
LTAAYFAILLETVELDAHLNDKTRALKVLDLCFRVSYFVVSVARAFNYSSLCNRGCDTRVYSSYNLR